MVRRNLYLSIYILSFPRGSFISATIFLSSSVGHIYASKVVTARAPPTYSPPQAVKKANTAHFIASLRFFRSSRPRPSPSCTRCSPATHRFST